MWRLEHGNKPGIKVLTAAEPQRRADDRGPRESRMKLGPN